MTPIGHASISYIAGAWYKSYLSFFVVGGLIPDIDFILLPFSFFNDLHRLITHNVFFVLIAAILLSLLFRKKYNMYLVFLIVILTGLLHLFIDSIIDSNPTNGIGVGLIWPVSDRFYSPFNLVRDSAMLSTGWDNLFLMVKSNIKYIIWEIPFLILAGFVLLKKKYGYR